MNSLINLRMGGVEENDFCGFVKTELVDEDGSLFALVVLGFVLENGFELGD